MKRVTPVKRLFMSAVSLAMIIPAVVRAQVPATAPATQPRGPDVTRMTLHMSPATRPALRYKLLPDRAEQQPGNAATLYLFAREFWPDQKTTTDILYPENEKYDYLGTPIDQFPRPYAERLLAGYAETLHYVDLAARRRDVKWDIDWQEGTPGGKPSWAYLNGLRHASNLLSFRVRYQISRGDWAAAEYTLRTHLSLARQVCGEPELVHGLVGSQFASIALYRGVEEWVGRAGSPNLYWALTGLPRPFIDVWPIAQSEQSAMFHWKPQLGLAVDGKLPPDQWPQVLREIVGLLQENRSPYKRDPAAAEPQVKRLIESTLPRARRYMLDTEMPADQVGAMPPEAVVGSYLCREYRAAADELWKAWALPYPQMEEQAMRSWRALAPDRPPLVNNPLVEIQLASRGEAGPDYSMPPVIRSRYQLARVDQHVAVLRTIEALRDYAARHGSRPPERLEEIIDLPVPHDPFTGKPFPYRLAGRTATLDAPAPSGRNPRLGWRFELTFAE